MPTETNIQFIVQQEQPFSISTNPNTTIDVVVEQSKNVEIEFSQPLVIMQGGSTNHSTLNNLDYENSGHTGFASSAEVVKITGDQEINGNKVFSSSVVIKGNLQVNGETNLINSNIVNIGDSIITLNADISDTTIPTENAGIQVKRGTEPTTGIYWKEDVDQWKVDNYKIAIEGDTLDGGTW